MSRCFFILPCTYILIIKKNLAIKEVISQMQNGSQIEQYLYLILNSLGGGTVMKFRAIIKKSGEWWIGWLIDLPGVNAQEKTREELIESLKFGAEDMLSLPIEHENGELVFLDVESIGKEAQVRM